MAGCGKDILLTREGTEQTQRFSEMLDPSWVKLNNFGLNEWMKFAWNFAAHLQYYGVDDDKVSSGNWQDFFFTKEELETFLKKVEDGQEITPHLALFVTFVKLLEVTQKHFNSLTQSHLDFYFNRVLKIEKQAAVGDQVHILFELAKNAVDEKIAAKTQLDAGKDATGKKLIYRTKEELIANQTVVAQLKSVYNDHEFSKIKAAEVANSFDGLGEDFPNKEIKWWPFGYFEPAPKDGDPDLREYPELADAKVGFAVSGEILELQEGERDVLIQFKFDTNLPASISRDELEANLEVFCTGEKGWIGPLEILEQSGGEDEDPVSFSSGVKSGDLKTLNILFRVPKEEEAVVKYDAKVHAEHFNASFPVCRVLFRTADPDAHQLYRELITKELISASVSVYVKGIESLSLSNDFGDINAAKPFYPFTTQPVKKSKFNINYPELFKKKWGDLHVKIDWKNTPDAFKEWYAAYRKSFKFQMTSLDYSNQIFSKAYIDSLIAPTPVGIGKVVGMAKFNFSNLIISSDEDFTAAVEIFQNEDWEFVADKKEIPLFDTKEDDGAFSMNFDVSNPESDDDKTGPIRLSLIQPFLHDMFPRLYAVAMSSEDKNILIPNEPYTPFVEKITLNYTAKAELKPSGESYDIEDFDLFHEHPFGQAKESITGKLSNKIMAKQEASKLRAVPNYCKGGELYIGLENAQKQQIVSLLIQVLEGSENPEAESFVGKQKVEWWMLCNNDWKQLDTTAIIANETDNLLKSGILKFTVPKEATNDNTLLPAGYMWLKARIHKKYNAVSKAIGIHAQAVVAAFSDNGNDLAHLKNGLPGDTISKMIFRIPKVKSLSQPYSSFEGTPEESDADYYRRVSERLRHKNRAISLWDYEHLVLQNFPEIHKVKCLNHTCSKIVNKQRKTRYLAPGSVVVVVVPDIVNKNVFDIYQPRVSKATLNNIENYLKKLNSPLINTVVINPEYEEVKVVLKVQFNTGFDNVYYKKILKEDLTKLLSPWAFDTTAKIRFGLSLHKSVVINYVEKLAYVDFVSDVKLFQKIAGTEEEVKVAVPSSPETILVSSKAHVVDDLINDCSKNEIEPAEKCQS
ncbi:phage baseplate protein [Maribellus luteus]|uniref:Phage baseplate protein n=1 Tax=Maribellus luteus TaxID=2305463 RepID=A0A399SVM9_9BACT|nr:baseplate J/gp47 family protein [Maribellus luteus]RIJ46702.1 phage baseplate protein [Maribellus luteus]